MTMLNSNIWLKNCLDLLMSYLAEDRHFILFFLAAATMQS